jgi:hypothetical protein
VSAVVAFLRVVLRDTWPAVTAVLCGVYVDGVRPRGTCGTHPEFIAVPLFLAALALSAAAIVTSLLRIVRRRSAATAVSTVVNAYAVTVALVLALPYA